MHTIQQASACFYNTVIPVFASFSFLKAVQVFFKPVDFPEQAFR